MAPPGRAGDPQHPSDSVQPLLGTWCTSVLGFSHVPDEHSSMIASGVTLVADTAFPRRP